MKATARHLICIAALLCISSFSYCQILKNIGNRVKQKAEQRANQKVDQTIDKGLDEVEKTGQKKDTTSTPGNTNNSNSTGSNPVAVNTKTEGNNPAVATAQEGFKIYSKFDFIPGDKVIAFEDFAQDGIGDFPEKWNTNSSGEVVTADGQTGHWLMIRKKGRFIPEHIKDLPDNYTLQFDLICNEKFNYYSSGLELFMLTGSNGKETFEYSFIPLEKRSGVKVYFHPTNVASTGGTASVETFEDGATIIKNEVPTTQFNTFAGKDKVKVSVWRQKQRIRVYLNEEKVFDLPRAFAANKTYSTVLFQIWGDMNNDEDRFLIGNINLAVGAPDTRNKLITEGRFVTRGILFDVNSDKIKPESYGTLKDIANVLKENADIKVKIIGHTDSDGTDVENLALSKRRAEAVKVSLAKDFEIDMARLTTDGKGESQPVDKNTTPEGKSNNRRVEFVKL